MTHRQGLYLILALTLLLRVGFGLTHSDLTHASDERHWDGLGKAYLALGILHPDTGMYRPPLYGLFLAASIRCLGARLPSCGSRKRLSHNDLLAHLHARMQNGPRQCAGRACGRGLVCHLSPVRVFFRRAHGRNPAGIFDHRQRCVLRSVLATKHIHAGHIIGVAVGLSALCKPVLLPWLPAVLCVWTWKSHLPRVQKAARIAVVIGSVSAVILPWTTRNYALSGEIVPISANLGINLLVGAHPQGRGYYDNKIDYLAHYRTLADTSHAAVADRKVAALSWAGSRTIPCTTCAWASTNCSISGAPGYRANLHYTMRSPRCPAARCCYSASWARIGNAARPKA